MIETKFKKSISTNQVIVRGPGLVNYTQHQKQVYIPDKSEDASGGTGEFPKDIKKFSTHQSTGILFSKPEPSFWLPVWIREHLNEGGSPESLVKEIIKKLKKDSNRENLREAQFILNELGRSSKNTEIIRKNVTGELIKEIMSKKQ